MTNLNKELSELLKKRISIYEESEKNGHRASQLDFLSFWVDSEELKKSNPFGIIRDNPNLEPTEYNNVYQFIDNKQLLLQYFPDDGSDPIAILQWYKLKIPVKTKELDGNGYKVALEEKWKISVYGKGLRLYYCGLLPWLPNYILKYAGEVYRADVCFDRSEKYPIGIIDKLKENLQKGSDDSRTYKTFGDEKSPLFIRIYDKTLDLKDHKRFGAWLYPSRYRQQCWRLECKFTGRYAKSQTAMERLGINPPDGKIEKIKECKRDYLKSGFYNFMMYIDYLPDKKLQYELLDGIRNLAIKKQKKLKDFISGDVLEND